MFTKQKLFTSAIALTAYSFLIAGSVASHEGDKDLQALQALDMTAQQVVSLQDAMKLVLDQTAGTIVEAEVEREEGKVLYEIEVTAPEGAHYEYLIDPLDGSQIDAHEDYGATLVTKLTTLIGEDPIAVDPSDFFAALENIEGRLLSLEIEDEEDLQIYEVKSIADGKVTKQLLNVATGDVVFYRHHDHHAGE